MYEETTTSPLEEWLNDCPVPGLTYQTHKRLEQALKMADRERLFPDGIKPVSLYQAVMCWRMIEQIKKDGFPKELEIEY